MDDTSTAPSTNPHQLYISRDWDGRLPEESTIDSFLGVLDCGDHDAPSENQFYVVPPDDKLEGKQFFSFGDKGTTISVSKWGNIVHFSNFVGAGKSGIWCVEPLSIEDNTVPTPGLVDLNSRSPDIGIGVRLELSSNNFESIPRLVRPRMRLLHDQWPEFQWESGHTRVSLQYNIQNGILVQHYNIETKSKELEGLFVLEKEMKLHDPRSLAVHPVACDASTFGPLRYSMFHLRPTECGPCSVNNLKQEEEVRSRQRQACIQRIPITSSNVGLNCIHKDFGSGKAQSQPAAKIPRAVAFVMSVFFNGVPQRLSMNSTKHNFLDGLAIPAGEGGAAGRLTLTVAYRLQPIFTASWKHLLIPSKDLAPYRKADCAIFQRLQFPDNTFLGSNSFGFGLFRTLLHVLTVCAIRIPDSQQSSHPRGAEDEEYFALTCGGVSGHQICSSASYFAFLFLTQFSTRLHKEFPNHPYSQSINEQIHLVCRGHLRWVFRGRKPDHNGRFHPAYFPNGEPVDLSTTPNHLRLYSNPLTEGAFQILKVKAYSRIVGTFYMSREPVDRELSDHLKSFAPSWMEFLSETLPEGGFTCWPRYRQDGVSCYRLDDQLWILKAWQYLNTNKVGAAERLSDVRILGHTAEEFAIALEKCFLASNPYTSQTMLATTRSSRKDKFLLHARDSAILYAMDSVPNSFGSSSRILPGLLATLQVQRHLKDNWSLPGWTNLLRLSLVLLFAKHGVQIGDMNPEEAASYCRKRLKDTIAFDGIFPGEILEGFGKSPESSDFHGAKYHASFEVPYVLLNECDFASEALDSITQNSARSLTIEDTDLGQDVTINSATPGQEAAQGSVVEVSQSHGNFAGRAIVEYPDEWLYRRPDFLHRQIIGRSQEITSKLIRVSDEDSRYAKITFEEHEVLASLPHAVFFDMGNEHFRVGGQTRPAKDGVCTVLNTPDSSWGLLQRLRTPSFSKKRLVYMPRNSPWLQRAFVVTTPTSERKSLTDFFTRMTSLESSFEEVASVPRNLWNTELFISFYKLLRPTDIEATGCSRSKNGETLIFGHDRIQRFVMGFRCSGDILDRYWTCYVVANGTNCLTPFIYRENEEVPPVIYGNPEHGTRTWHERRVLELIVFEYIVENLLRSTRELFQVIDDGLKLQHWRSKVVSNQVATTDQYFQVNSERQTHQRTLYMMLESLDSAMYAIGSWNRREQDRGDERPRWTTHKERKYGRAINQLHTSNRRKIRELEFIYQKVVALKASDDSLDRAMEKVRCDLALRQAEEGRWLTYLTSCFQPLSFASSIYSMNGIPAFKVVVRMVITAVMAICVTMGFVFGSRHVTHPERRAFDLKELWDMWLGFVEYCRLKFSRRIAPRMGDEEVLGREGQQGRVDEEEAGSGSRRRRHYAHAP